MNQPTVGQIRAAIEGLADDSPAILMISASHLSPDEVFITLAGFARGDLGLHVHLVVEGIEDVGDWDDGILHIQGEGEPL